jgi:hypothetical protein
MTLTWHNHTGNQKCHPRAIEYPESLERLVSLVQEAEAAGSTVRAVGAHHAWSDVALTDGTLIEPDNIGAGLLQFDDSLKQAAGSEPLVRVLAGTHLRDLNPALEREGLALKNMGGYDAQTIAGVVATSTHGSGLKFGPFPDVVQSLDMVVEGGRIVRVEPREGPTDSPTFEALYGESRELIQEDDAFYAAVCGMGCMGLIHSLVLQVRDAFWLNEVRSVSSWEEVKKDLRPEGVLNDQEHFELFLNPYPDRHGKHPLLVTTRTERPASPGAPEDKLERHPLMEAQSAFPGTWILVRTGARFFPSLVARGFNWLLGRMRDDGYASTSYRVFNIGEANKVPAYSSELGVSLEGDKHIDAIDRLLELANEYRSDRLYHTSPIALRFVAPSRAYASMMYGRETMMIELIMAKDTRHGFDLLARYEQDLAEFDVRPHWGQYNELSPATDFQDMYDRWDAWLATYRKFNSSGVFNSEFTDRIGISVPRP